MGLDDMMIMMTKTKWVGSSSTTTKRPVAHKAYDRCKSYDDDEMKLPKPKNRIE